MNQPALTRYVDVVAAFADPRLIPPPAPATGPVGTTAWLRATVSRFSTGAEHRRRRALAEAELATLDPTALRGAARARTRRYDAPTEAGHQVPVAVLADALGVDGRAVTDAVAAVSPAYFGAAHSDANADAAAGALFDLAGPGEPERRAARIGLLVQASASTAGLIGNALAVSEHLPPSNRWPVADLLTETLRYAPPVPAGRRQAATDVRIGGVAVAAGIVVVLDLAAANRDPDVFVRPDRFEPGRRGPTHLTFGGPPRVCPGRDHALAIAAGVFEAVWSR
jgi:cytochrome P450